MCTSTIVKLGEIRNMSLFLLFYANVRARSETFQKHRKVIIPTELNVTRENPSSAFHSKLVSSDIFGSKSQEKTTFSVVVSPRLIHSSTPKNKLRHKWSPRVKRFFFPFQKKSVKFMRETRKMSKQYPL